MTLDELLEDWKKSSHYVSNIISNPEQFYQWMNSLSPENRQVLMDSPIFSNQKFKDSYQTYQAYYDLINGKMNANDFLGFIGSNNYGTYMNPEMNQYVTDALSNQRTNEARQWEEYAARNQYLWSGEQAQQLGLSPSVISFGSSQANPVAAAEVSQKNLAQERSMARYEQRMALAKQLISMTGSMASAGIYGKAIGTARRVSGILSSQAAHSGLAVLKHHNGYGNPTFSVDENGLATGY